ncbi:hypothetical protein ABKN59_011336 [Abortiporus biennis]
MFLQATPSSQELSLRQKDALLRSTSGELLALSSSESMPGSNITTVILSPSYFHELTTIEVQTSMLESIEPCLRPRLGLQVGRHYQIPRNVLIAFDSTKDLHFRDGTVHHSAFPFAQPRDTYLVSVALHIDRHEVQSLRIVELYFVYLKSLYIDTTSFCTRVDHGA